jgi:hypothetical protein
MQSWLLWQRMRALFTVKVYPTIVIRGRNPSLYGQLGVNLRVFFDKARPLCTLFNHTILRKVSIILPRYRAASRMNHAWQ